MSDKDLDVTTSEDTDAAQETDEQIFDAFVSGKHLDADGHEDENRDEQGEDSSETNQDSPTGEDTQNGGSEEEADDIWADVPEAAKAAYEQERQRARAAEGRLKATHAQLRKIRMQPPKQTPSKPTPKTGAAEQDAEQGSSTDDTELARLREDYPEVANPLLSEIERLSKHVESLTHAETDRFDQLVAAEQSKLEAKHSDWNTVAGTQDFLSWVADQPLRDREVYDANSENIIDGEGAADLITRFKASRGQKPNQQPGQQTQQKPLSSRRRAQMQGSRDMPRGGTSRAVTNEPPDTASEEVIFDHFAEKAKERMAR
jgi:hypothetical protein